jgi:P-type Ca2+ transporter type 2C
LIASVLLTFALQLAIIYIPALQKVFATQPLSVKELLICLGVSFLVLVAVEAEKLIRRRKS